MHDVSEARSYNSADQSDDYIRIPNRHNDSSAYEYDSLPNSPTTKEPRFQIIGLKKPEVYKW